MLVLTVTRHGSADGTYVDVDGPCRVYFVSGGDSRAKLGFEAPRSTQIARSDAGTTKPQNRKLNRE